MHPITTYSDDDREEFLARSKLLDHEWQIGDWGWVNMYETQFVDKRDKLGPQSILLDQIYPNFHYRLQFGGSYGRRTMESIIWLPLMDDIMNMKGWGDPIFDDLIDKSLETPNLLFFLQAVQYCPSVCDIIEKRGGGTSARICAGIHKENEPHLCLTHFRENKK